MTNIRFFERVLKLLEFLQLQVHLTKCLGRETTTPYTLAFYGQAKGPSLP